MGHRLSRAHKRKIIQEMRELARVLTTEGIPVPSIREAVEQVRTDLVQALSQGITVLEVNPGESLADWRRKGEETRLPLPEKKNPSP